MNTNSHTRWVLILTGVGSLMAALDTLVVSTALSTIRLDLGASIEQLEWTVNAYNLSFAVLLMTGAALGDRFGRRNLYAAGLVLFAVASAACALAPDRRLADRRPGGPGRGLGAHRAARTGASERGLPARAPGHGDRDLQRDHRPRGRQRPAGGRGGRPGPRLAVDLLDQPADRPHRRPARAAAHAREPRRGYRARHPRARARHRAAPSASSGRSCAATRSGGAAPR